MKHIESYQYSEKELSAIVGIIGSIHYGIKSQIKKIAESMPESWEKESLRMIDGKLDLLQAALPLIGPWMLSERHSLHEKWLQRLSTLQTMLDGHHLTMNDFINKAD